MKIKEMELTDLLKLRDSIKIVCIYLEIPLLRKIQAEVAERLEQLKERQ
jgi:hypothetical protein